MLQRTPAFANPTITGMALLVSPAQMDKSGTLMLFNACALKILTGMDTAALRVPPVRFGLKALMLAHARLTKIGMGSLVLLVMEDAIGFHH